MSTDPNDAVEQFLSEKAKRDAEWKAFDSEAIARREPIQQLHEVKGQAFLAGLSDDSEVSDFIKAVERFLFAYRDRFGDDLPAGWDKIDAGTDEEQKIYAVAVRVFRLVWGQKTDDAEKLLTQVRERTSSIAWDVRKAVRFTVPERFISLLRRDYAAALEMIRPAQPAIDNRQAAQTAERVRLNQFLDGGGEAPTSSDAADKTAPAADQGESKAEGETQAPAGAPLLSQLQYEILDALLALKATDPAKRKTAEQVAPKIGGDTTTASCKVPIADLKDKGLVDTKEGRGGGCWLTPNGIELTRKL